MIPRGDESLWEGVELEETGHCVVPSHVIGQVDPLVISMRTQEGFIYDWSGGLIV